MKNEKADKNCKTMFETIQEFIKAKGRLPKKESPLKKWCDLQRKHYKIGSASSERVKLLESVPAWTWGK